MAIGSGLDTQHGMKAESVYGTPVTVDSFTDIESETVKAVVTKIESAPVRGLTMRKANVKTVISGAGGDIVYPFYNKGMGKLLKQCFGSVVSAVVGATTEYTHTFTLDEAAGKRGTMATVQLGRASVDGTVRPFTYEGGKVTAFTISMDDQGLLKLTITWDFEDEKTGTALASASYVTNLEMFGWNLATVSLGGTPVFVKTFSMNVAWAFDVERRGLSQTLKKEPIANGKVVVTGEMEGEFESLTHYNNFIAGTTEELIFTVTGSDIPSETEPYQIVITVASAELTGDTPNASGPAILMQPRPWRALDNDTDPLVELVVHNDETTI